MRNEEPTPDVRDALDTVHRGLERLNHKLQAIALIAVDLQAAYDLLEKELNP